MSIITKAQRFASLSQTAIDTINPSIFKRANRMLEHMLDSELYAKYIASVSAVSVISVDLGSPTTITTVSSRFRRDGIFLKFAGFTDDGLYQINGRHEILYVSDSGFTIDIDTTNADAYTSGGTVIEAVMDELEDAEAYLLLYVLLPSLIDIKKGNAGVILPSAIEWGGGSVAITDSDELNKVRAFFHSMAITAIQNNIDDGKVPNLVQIIGV